MLKRVNISKTFTTQLPPAHTHTHRDREGEREKGGAGINTSYQGSSAEGEGQNHQSQTVHTLCELTLSEDGERGCVLTENQLLEEELLFVLLTLH